MPKNASREERLKVVETSTDYLYVGSDLRPASPELEKDLLVAVSNTTIMRVSLAIVTADEKARFINAENVMATMKACNEARAKIGLGALRPPEIMENVQKEAAATQR